MQKVLAGDTFYLKNKVPPMGDFWNWVSESTAKKIVVVAHHLPTLQVVAPQHKGSPINSAFATELGDFIADGRIDCWIYGHSHTNINTQIGGTKIVCNQLGYVSQHELDWQTFQIRY